jgi:predicted nucleotidyltransferase
MPYLSQVDALLVRARRYLAEAELQRDNWPFCGSALARALEHAVCAVFMAWDEPYKASRKVHRHFGERLAPLIDPAIPPVVCWVWEYEGSGKPDAVAELLVGCEQVVDALEILVANPAPSGWQALPISEPVGWERLSEHERSLLTAVLEAARQGCPNVRLLLFGSRAVGKAQADSDYDVLFIFPDEFPETGYGQSIGRAVELAARQGSELDAPSIRERVWLTPSTADRPLVTRIRACHIEVRDR